MNSKDRENLSYLYELDQFKSLVKLAKIRETDLVTKVLGTETTEPASAQKIALLQGQVFALRAFIAEIKKIHKASQKD